MGGATACMAAATWAGLVAACHLHANRRHVTPVLR